MNTNNNDNALRKTDYDGLIIFSVANNNHLGLPLPLSREAVKIRWKLNTSTEQKPCFRFRVLETGPELQISMSVGMFLKRRILF
mmetsp:Transcript_25379/g.55739  ORF Transcript_25379/g.55739 Transcript_25379/m.55739 type:complete len:84 (+) Transcript_25379:33-284(+)